MNSLSPSTSFNPTTFPSEFTWKQVLDPNQEIPRSRESAMFSTTSAPDCFLLFLYEQEIIDENGWIRLEKSFELPALPQLEGKEILKLLEFLTEPFSFELVIDRKLIDEFILEPSVQITDAKKLEKFLKSAFFLSQESRTLKGTFPLWNLFLYLYEASQKEGMGLPQQFLNGGYVIHILENWFKRAAKSLGLTEEMLPSEFFEDFQNPVISDHDIRMDLPHATYDHLRELDKKTLDFLCDTLDLESEHFEYFHALLKKLGVKVKELFQPPDILSSVAFGNERRIDLLFSQTLKRRHLFILNALVISIHQLIKDLASNSDLKVLVEKKDTDGLVSHFAKHGSISAESDYKQLWQVIIDRIGYLIHIDNPDEVDEKGWARFFSLISKGHRSPDPGIALILFQSVLKTCGRYTDPLFPQRRQRKIIELLKSCCLSHHQGNQEILFAMTFNAIFSIRSNDIGIKFGDIWSKLCLDKKEEPGGLFTYLVRAFEKDLSIYEEVLAVLQIAAFLRIQTVSNGEGDIKVNLVYHEGKPVLQLIDKYALLLPCNFLEALEVLVRIKENRKLQEILKPVIDYLFPNSLIDFSPHSQIKCNLNRLPVDLDTLENAILSLFDKPVPLLAKMGYQTLLTCQSLRSNSKVTFTLLKYFLDILSLNKDLTARGMLITNVENIVKQMKPSFSLNGMRQLNETHVQTKVLGFEFVKVLATSQDLEFKSLFPIVFRAVFRTLSSEQAKEYGKVLLKIIPSHQVSEICLVFHYLQNTKAFQSFEELVLFGEMLKRIPQDQYFQLESLFQQLLEHQEASGVLKEKCPYTKEFASLIYQLFLLNPSKNEGFLGAATRLAIVTPRSDESVWMWFEACKICVSRLENGAQKVLMFWKIAGDLNVPLVPLSLDRALFISNLQSHLETILPCFEKGIKFSEEDISQGFDSILQSDWKKATRLFFYLLHSLNLTQDNEDIILKKVLLKYKEIDHLGNLELSEFELLTDVVEAFMAKRKNISLSLTQSKESYAKQTVKSRRQKSLLKFHEEIMWLIRKLFEKNRNEEAKALFSDVLQEKLMTSREAMSSWFAICQEFLVVGSVDRTNLVVECWKVGLRLSLWNISEDNLEIQSFYVDLCKAIFKQDGDRDSLKELLKNSFKICLKEQFKNSIRLLVGKFLEGMLHENKTEQMFQDIEALFKDHLPSNQKFILKVKGIEAEIFDANFSQAITLLSAILKDECVEQEKNELQRILDLLLANLLSMKKVEIKQIWRLLQIEGFQRLFLGHVEEQIKFLLKFATLIKEDEGGAFQELSLLFARLILKEIFPSNMSFEIRLRVCHYYLSLLGKPSHIIAHDRLAVILSEHLSQFVGIFIKEKLFTELCSMMKDVFSHSTKSVFSQQIVQDILWSIKEALTTKTADHVNLIYDLLILLRNNGALKIGGFLEQAEICMDLVNGLTEESFNISERHEKAITWIQYGFILENKIDQVQVSAKSLFNWSEKYRLIKDFKFSLEILDHIFKRSNEENLPLLARSLYLLALDTIQTPQMAGQILIDYCEPLKAFTGKESLILASTLIDTFLQVLNPASVEIAWKLMERYNAFKSSHVRIICDFLLLPSSRSCKVKISLVLKTAENKKKFYVNGEDYFYCWMKYVETLRDDELSAVMDSLQQTAFFQIGSLHIYRGPIVKCLLDKMVGSKIEPELILVDMLDCKELFLLNNNADLVSLIDSAILELDPILIEFKLQDKSLESYIKLSEYIKDVLLTYYETKNISSQMVKAVTNFILQGIARFPNIESAILEIMDITERVIDLFDARDLVPLLIPFSSHFMYPLRRIACHLLVLCLNLDPEQNLELKQPLLDALKLLTKQLLEISAETSLTLQFLNHHNVGNWFSSSDLKEISNSFLLGNLKSALVSKDFDISKHSFLKIREALKTLHLDMRSEVEYVKLAFDHFLILLEISTSSDNLLLYQALMELLLGVGTKEPKVQTDNLEKFFMGCRELMKHIELWLSLSDDQRALYPGDSYYTQLEGDIVKVDFSKQNQFSAFAICSTLLKVIWEVCKTNEKFISYIEILIGKLLDNPTKKPSLDLFTLYFVHCHLEYLLLYHKKDHKKFIPLFEKFMFSPLATHGLIFESHKRHVSVLFEFVRAMDKLDFVSMYPELNLMVQIFTREAIAIDCDVKHLNSAVTKVMLYLFNSHSAPATKYGITILFGKLPLSLENMPMAFDLAPIYAILHLALKNSDWKFWTQPPVNVNQLGIEEKSVLQHLHDVLLSNSSQKHFVKRVKLFTNLISEIASQQLASDPSSLINNAISDPTIVILDFIKAALRLGAFKGQYKEFYHYIEFFLSQVTGTAEDERELVLVVNKYDFKVFFQTQELTHDERQARSRALSIWLQLLIRAGYKQTVIYAHQCFIELNRSHNIFQGFLEMSAKIEMDILKAKMAVIGQ